jgi:transcription elongation factor GreA
MSSDKKRVVVVQREFDMLLDRPVYITSKGITELKEELAYLRNVKRLEIIDRLHDAKGGGDWMDSTEYVLIEEELAFVNGRIQELEDMLDHAHLIGTELDATIINVGDSVVIQDSDGELEEYTIVGVAEANPGKGLISNESPLGRALLGHTVNDEVVFKAPAGEMRYRVVAHT